MKTYIDGDGFLTIFDNKFDEAICSKLGIDIMFKKIKWDRKEIELETKKKKKKKKNIDFVWIFIDSDWPYINNKQVVIIKQSDASKYTNVKSLFGA